jgi:hypothetical protein
MFGEDSSARVFDGHQPSTEVGHFGPKGHVHIV